MNGEGRYDQVLDRLQERAPLMARHVARERQLGEGFLHRFDSLNRRQQEVLVRNRRRYGRHVIEGLLRRARDAAHRDPHVSLRLARLALVALERATLLDSGRDELAMAARMEEANGLRITGDLAGAAAAWAAIDADPLLVPVDVLQRAKMLSLRASFEDWRRRHRVAVSLLRRAVSLYSRHGDRLTLVRTLAQLSPVLVRAGEAAEGLRVAHQTCRMLQPADDGRLRFFAVHNLAYAAAELGELDLVAQVLEASALLYDRYAGELDLLRRDWLRARIRLELGDLPRADSDLERISEAFVGRGMLYEHALLGLDRCVVWARQSRWHRIRSTGQALVDVFAALGVEPEGCAALLALRSATAARGEEVLTVLAGLAEVLRRSRRP